MDPAMLLLPLAAVIAPLIAAVVRRALVVPLVVFEIGLGMLLGPGGLGWIVDDEALQVFSRLGLAMLFFMAGNEVDPASLRGSIGRRALVAWGASAALALAAGAMLAAFAPGVHGPEGGAIVAIALTGTALGTIMPMLRDAGILPTRLGSAIVAGGTVGEFAPLVAISVFLSGRQPLVGTILLLVFAGIAGFAFWLAARGPQGWLRRMVTATLHTSGQFAIRFVILLLASLVALAMALGVDFLLGAFTAGMLARVVLRGGDAAEQHVIGAKLESIAFGFFVPIFFVSAGVAFPVRELLGDAAMLALVPLFALAMLVVRGVPGWCAPERGSPRAERRTAALFTATTLPLVIAITDIGVQNGALGEGIAAAMVGGAMLTVLLFPLLGLLGRGESRAAARPDRFPAEAHE